MLETKLLSSLHKVYPDSAPDTDYTGGSVLQNEPFSFQVAYRLKDGGLRQNLTVSVECDGLPISEYRVDNVYLSQPRFSIPCGEERTQPGMFPDMLSPRLVNAPVEDDGFWAPLFYEQGEENLVYALDDTWKALWFTVNEDGAVLEAGEHTVTVKFFSAGDQSLLAQESVSVTILPACLPKRTLLVTNWFHCDCLCDAHRVEMFSDAFFEILYSYAREASVNGQNMFMLPAFTPALDTSVGKERQTAQLVKITAENTADGWQYSFDFSLMKRYVDVCRQAGITHFEHAHFFTQWGAKCAPKIIVNGEKMFGWHTPATEGEYPRFLAQYIPALRKFLRQEDLEDKVLFHVSDEPQGNQLDAYAAAHRVVDGLLEGCLCGDALSHFEYYEKGLVSTPVVATCDIEPFLGKCDTMWCYYTGDCVKNNLSNRLINLSSQRNRVIGMQMYRHKVKGFLDWGFNYYYNTLSHGYFDPHFTPDAFEGHTGGAFLVYPSHKGTALPSIRLKVFGEGINDYGALQLLEELTDRETVDNMLDNLFMGHLDFHTNPATPEEFLFVRRTINAALAAALKTKSTR